MYSAAPITRLTQTSGLAAGGLGSAWTTGLTGLHVVVAVTSLLALLVAMTKLWPMRRRGWAPPPGNRRAALPSRPEPRASLGTA
ncbi:hypothetical protein [Knoellia locipacati]|uniref:hypothetical protein n=1 Tax=Knoellia locipacati TaxID=882824 RepID=UPI0011BDA899|nr:hypothetical protein [Knoellia locipacati]